MIEKKEIDEAMENLSRMKNRKDLSLVYDICTYCINLFNKEKKNFGNKNFGIKFSELIWELILNAYVLNLNVNAYVLNLNVNAYVLNLFLNA